MPSNSKSVSKSLQKTAKNIAKLPAGIVADAALEGVEYADREGGSFFRGRASLYGEVKSVRKNKSGAKALIIGRPAGAWVIKSFGHDRVVPKRRSVLRGFTGSTMWFARSTGPAGPLSDGHWSKVEEQVDAALDGIADSMMEGAINGS